MLDGCPEDLEGPITGTFQPGYVKKTDPMIRPFHKGNIGMWIILCCQIRKFHGKNIFSKVHIIPILVIITDVSCCIDEKINLAKEYGASAIVLINTTPTVCHKKETFSKLEKTVVVVEISPEQGKELLLNYFEYTQLIKPKILCEEFNVTSECDKFYENVKPLMMQINGQTTSEKQVKIYWVVASPFLLLLLVRLLWLLFCPKKYSKGGL